MSSDRTGCCCKLAVGSRPTSGLAVCSPVCDLGGDLWSGLTWVCFSWWFKTQESLSSLAVESCFFCANTTQGGIRNLPTWPLGWRRLQGQLGTSSFQISFRREAGGCCWGSCWWWPELLSCSPPFPPVENSIRIEILACLRVSNSTSWPGAVPMSALKVLSPAESLCPRQTKMVDCFGQPRTHIWYTLYKYLLNK